MRDIVLVTAESVRRDHVDALPFVSSLDVLTGVAGAHYTRPSLASILSSSYRAAMRTEVVHPTLAETLSANGYHCIGLTTSPQADETFGFDSGFGEYDNFVEPGIRGTALQEVLAQFDVVGRVYNRLFPRHDRRSHLPRDDEVVERAIEAFDDASPPRFLWMHFMESHRPYGRGDDAISPSLDRRAKYSPGTLTEDDRQTIRTAYRDSLARVDDWVEHLLDGIDAEPVFAFAGDHGEGFGEDGYYFHPPQRMRVDDHLTRVPVVFDDVDPAGDRLSLLDIAPTVVSAVGLDVPPSWHGNDLTVSPTEHTLTIAPWRERATVLWQDWERKLVARDADLSLVEGEEFTTVERTDVTQGMKQQLRDLGYIDAG